MNAKWLTITTVFVFIYLVLVNAFVFPVIFPDGLVEKFVNTRAEGLPLFHLLAFGLTAVLLTVLVDKLRQGRNSVSAGLSAGIWLGLLVALPEHLHLYAMVDAPAVHQFTPVLWVVVTWGFAGLVVGVIGGKVGSSDGGSSC